MAQALVLDGHSRAAIEATQSLGRAGVTVTVSSSDPTPITFRSRYAHRRLPQPPALPEEPFLAWMRELDARARYDLIIPSTENALQAFLALDADDSLRRRAVLSSNQSLAHALDRRLTWKLAAELGVPVPATRLIESLPSSPTSATSFPTVLKPARSKILDRGVLRTFAPVIARDAECYTSVLRDWIPRMAVLEQEYVQGWGVGIELLYREGRCAWYFAHERLHEWPLTGGASTYRRAIEPPAQMLEAARALLDRLEWHGVAMVEFKRRTDGSFALMEINPRLWGSLALSIDAGVNFPLGLLRLATGGDLDPQPHYRRGMRTRHISADVVWQKANLFADRQDPLLLVRPRLRSMLEPLLLLSGQERWDHFSWLDPAPGLHECRRVIQTVHDAVRRSLLIRSLRRRRKSLVQRAVRRITAAQGSRPPVILFLCEGNICRSPFAELVARQKLPGYHILSAGFDQRAQRSTPLNVSSEAARLNYDMSDCRSTPVTESLLRSADLVCIMDLGQHTKLAERFPGIPLKSVPLGLFCSPPIVEIQDPDRRDAPTTRRILGQILSAVEGLTDALNATIPDARPVRSGS